MIQPVFISWRAEKDQPRSSLFGKVCKTIGQHPTRAGLLFGIAAVAVALIRAPGTLNSPLEAGLLAGIIILLTTAVFSRTGHLFAWFSIQRLSVVRVLTFDGQTLQWLEDNTILKSIESPTFDLHADPVPEAVQNQAEKPWPALLHIHNQEVSLVIATKLAATEATHLTPLPHHPHDTLPTHVLSPLLILARHPTDPIIPTPNGSQNIKNTTT